jgi:predicted dehydrogenase
VACGAHIAAAIQERRPPTVTIADGLIALATVRAVCLSATLGRPVAVNDVVDGGPAPNRAWMR